MSVSAVDSAIRKIREVVGVWAAAGETDWREDHTRYAVIDPIILALGWDTADPKVCHPEFPRPFPKRVDYALFAGADVDAIVNGLVVPDVIIESKALRAELDGGVSQLRSYASASPRMYEGFAVLTNGNEWRIYDVSRSGRFAKKEVERVDILTDDVRGSARVLNRLLGRGGFG